MGTAASNIYTPAIATNRPRPSQQQGRPAAARHIRLFIPSAACVCVLPISQSLHCAATNTRLNTSLSALRAFFQIAAIQIFGDPKKARHALISTLSLGARSPWQTRPAPEEKDPSLPQLATRAGSGVRARHAQVSRSLFHTIG